MSINLHDGQADEAEISAWSIVSTCLTMGLRLGARLHSSANNDVR